MNRALHTSLVWVAIALGTGQIYAQSTLNGRVVDKEGQAVAGATVTDLATRIKTQTNAEGRFTLSIKADKPAISISYIGYEEQTLSSFSLSENLLITLQPSPEQLNEVVVTALGISREKKALGYAVQEVKGVELQTWNCN
ncbi:CarboxypepD_reg-like domain-containing protein [Sphingobacterium nematocida]|uniref:CarboxypepD_reg-like domain-containing protein n=1 Tax=Sphingobacterium nematocida TaxID=1513896 RepID=A0A1T5GFE9_9SPHI|nr:carboxypeptidase-like regulatory domain-containing protein [Sphingobacterium nematocida]SKC07136.1 CarboxypepD_reg-like domain-containing protein [Sphingobacterium nematocida]